MTIAAIIVAGGSGSRFGSNKLLQPLAGLPVVLHSISLFSRWADLCVVVVPQTEETTFRTLTNRHLPDTPLLWAHGGQRRGDSVLAGLRQLPPDVDFVAIHDGARPLITATLASLVMAEARRSGGAIPGRAVVDTLQRVDLNDNIIETVPRDHLFRVETPQCFNLQKLLDAYSRDGACDCTDDAAVMRRAGYQVKIVAHEEENGKITYRSDLPWFEWLIRHRNG